MVAFQRLTLAEQAYAELREQIVSGQLPAGRRLLANELAGLLAISQTPVKEALSRLEQDGLVEGASRRGSIVRRFTLSDIREIYEARLLLECHAATVGLAGGGVTAAFIDRLQTIFGQQMAEIAKQTAEGLAETIRLDRQFHEIIVALAENQLTAGWHRIALRQTQTIRNYSLTRYDAQRLGHEHGAIIEAFRSLDSEGVGAALRFHLTASRDEFLSRPPEDLPIRP